MVGPGPTRGGDQLKPPLSFFMGTNANSKHLEEATRQQIIAPGEHLMGFFDGIFFDATGKRVGGLALHDYLIVTDRHLIMWARDQFKDYVDRFPLSHCFLTSAEPKDMLHGTLKLGLVLPQVEEAEVAQAAQIEICFDLVPLPDLKQISGLIEVLTNLHHEMIAGGAGEADRRKASWVLFNRVFVGPLMAEQARQPQPSAQAANSWDNEPLVEIVEGAAIDDLMTPLSRLDNLDNFNRPSTPASIRPPQAVRRPASNSYGAADSGGSLDEIEAELQWLNEGKVYSSSNTGPAAQKGRLNDSQNQPRRKAAAHTLIPGPTPSPAARLKQDLNQDGLYTVGRAGRVMWDGLEKLKREGEAKFESKGRPTLQTLKDSGMNLKDITDFLTAINGLLDTVNRSPAAREIAMTFLNRSSFLSNLVPNQPAKRGVPEVEEIMDDSAAPGSSPRQKVQRRDTPRPASSQIDPFNPPRYKVAIRKRGSEAEVAEPDEVVEAKGSLEKESFPKSAEVKLAEDFEELEPVRSSGQAQPSSKRRMVPVRSMSRDSEGSNSN